MRYAGDIDTKAFDYKRLRYFPKHVDSGHMGILTSAIGFDPIIRLQAAGLKAAELSLKNKTKFKLIPILEYI